MTTDREVFDENIVCPITGNPLILQEGYLTTVDRGESYDITDGILRLFVESGHKSIDESDAVTEKVQDFYTVAPFPNYNDFDDISVFIEKANRGVFARLLRQQIPMNSTILEVGCGTGQLSNYLAATTASRVYATDMTLASLKLGVDFANANDIKGIKFLQMNLFEPCIKKNSMDLVISNGVLHHTADAKAAFQSIASLVKPGGHIIVGLYNKIGRLRTDLRRVFFKTFGESALYLDPHLRTNISGEKRRAWIQDQYLHPQETKHTMSETLEWFSEEEFSFISSIPKIMGDFTADEQLFEPKSPGSGFDRVSCEVGMLFSHFGGEGGLFIMIGQKN